MHVRQQLAILATVIVGVVLVAVMVFVRIEKKTFTQGAQPSVIKAFYTTLVERAQSSFGRN